MEQSVSEVGRDRVQNVDVKVVDADVHPAARSLTEIRQYLPEPWRSRRFSDQMLDAVEAPIYLAPGKAQRRDAYPPGGGPPCSDPAFTERQLFGDAGVDYAILIPLTVRTVANPELEAAVCAATNSWLADTWLSAYNRHGRYRGTLRVCSSQPDLAVGEIERWAGHPYFVQIMLVAYNSAPYGHPQFHPIYEAAARHHLPVAIHVNRSLGMAGLLTPVGFASYFIEHHSLYSLIYASHLANLIVEGVFDKFPGLRVVLAEGGFSWVVPLLWRLDNLWTELHAEAPAAKRRPSEYVRDHVRFTSQPIEEPQELRHLQRVLEWGDAARILMFATDYPHWDYDDPKYVFPRLPARMRERILCGNALELYDLPRTRRADVVARRTEQDR
jgi:predicted TIM-barrel fold metal-dependent hydrolase